MSERAAQSPERRRATQAELEDAIRRYSTAAGEAANRVPLASPLTAAELASGPADCDGVGITSVDMTPRPRYGDTQAKFEARMHAMGVVLEHRKALNAQENRANALKSVEVETSAQFPIGVAYWTQCACRWCGIRVGDPEVARREYDAHPCRADGIGQAAVDRAIAETDRQVLHRRETNHSVLKPAIPNESLDAALRDLKAPHVQRVEADEAIERFALLEGIPR